MSYTRVIVVLLTIVLVYGAVGSLNTAQSAEEPGWLDPKTSRVARAEFMPSHRANFRWGSKGTEYIKPRRDYELQGVYFQVKGKGRRSFDILKSYIKPGRNNRGFPVFLHKNHSLKSLRCNSTWNKHPRFCMVLVEKPISMDEVKITLKIRRDGDVENVGTWTLEMRIKSRPMDWGRKRTISRYLDLDVDGYRIVSTDGKKPPRFARTGYSFIEIRTKFSNLWCYTYRYVGNNDVCDIDSRITGSIPGKSIKFKGKTGRTYKPLRHSNGSDCNTNSKLSITYSYSRDYPYGWSSGTKTCRYMLQVPNWDNYLYLSVRNLEWRLPLIPEREGKY